MKRQQQHLYKIGDLAKFAGVTVRTIRCYEELGLMIPSKTSPGGFRLYSENDKRRLFYIKQFKELEFPLEDIKALLSSPIPAKDKNRRIATSLALTEKQLKQVESKILVLEKVKQEIKNRKDTLLKCKSCQFQPCLPE